MKIKMKKEESKEIINNDWEKKLIKELDSNYSTQGYEKLWNYFLDSAKTDYFQNKVLNIRKLFKIPDKGFDTEKVYYALEISYKEIPGRDWRKDATKLKEYDVWKGEDLKRLSKAKKHISQESYKICEKYHLHYLDWSDVIEDYIYFNRLEKTPPRLYYTNSYNLCMLADLQEIVEDPFSKKLTEADNDIFPIAIRISPYASERDILDYVRKMAPAIKEWQKPYIKPGVKIGKIRKKNPLIEERNNFVYENRSLSYKKIVSLVMKKFPEDICESIDEGAIGKIISLERNKRKQV